MGRPTRAADADGLALPKPEAMPVSITQQLSTLDPMPLIVALIVGGIIGFEREVHGRPAGVRTHMLVCLASAVLIQASHLAAQDVGLQSQSDAFRVVVDPNRLAAGIVTGIGFLGAATVIRSGDIVRGITTGATVWAVAGLGIVVGQREYGLALIAAGIMLVLLAGVDRLTRGIAPIIYRRLTVRGKDTEMTRLSETVGGILTSHGIRVQDLSGSLGPGDDPFELVFHIRARNVQQAPEMLEIVAKQPGVASVEWSAISH